MKGEVKSIEHGGFSNPVFSRNHVDLAFAGKWNAVLSTEALEIFNVDGGEGDHASGLQMCLEHCFNVD